MNRIAKRVELPNIEIFYQIQKNPNFQNKFKWVKKTYRYAK